MDRLELTRRLEAVLGPVPAGAAGRTGIAVVAEREPARFKAALAAAVAGRGPVVLADPGWGERERGELRALLAAGDATERGERDDGWLLIPSGGTGGRVKLARHDGATLAAAAAGFADHFGIRKVDAVGVLPLHHVSGLMGWLRSVVTGGRHAAADWKDVEAGRWPEPPAGGTATLSLVPTQLQRLLGRPEAEAWLRRFAAVAVGGGPAWAELLERAAAARVPLAPSYGMTETAAMATALRPEEFLAGGRSSGRALPHARVEIGADGRIGVGGASLFRGYYPERRHGTIFRTEDTGNFDAQGCLHVAGRSDAAIVTGGKKVQPAEVEAALRASGECDDVAVIGVPDPEWGEAVVACYPGGGRRPDAAKAAAALPGWARPKRWVPVEPWPRNAQGKVNRAVLRAAAGGPEKA